MKLAILGFLIGFIAPITVAYAGGATLGTYDAGWTIAMSWIFGLLFAVAGWGVQDYVNSNKEK